MGWSSKFRGFNLDKIFDSILVISENLKEHYSYFQHPKYPSSLNIWRILRVITIQIFLLAEVKTFFAN